MHRLDLLLIHPGAAHGIYGTLGDELTAVEPPMWARLIAGYCRDRGHEVRIVDAEAQGLSPKDVARIAEGERPRLICIAAYGHQPSASTQQMPAAHEIGRAIKNNLITYGPIMMLGGHVSALPERTMREEPIELACVGEGPITVERVLADDQPRDIPGLVWRDGDRLRDHKIIVNPRAPLIENLGLLHGDVWDLLPMSRYRAHNWQCFGDLSKRKPYASIYTSLGCPYSCSFCMINAPFGTNRYRMRDPADVVAEVVALYNEHGVSTFKIIDEMFVLNERHYMGIAARLIESGISDKLNIWAYARVDTVKPHTLALLRKAGFRWLALGIESGSAHVRDGADKRMKNDDIKGVVRAIQDADINVIGNYIFGLPDDTVDTMNETFALSCDLNTEFANYYSAMAYPGSLLYAQAVKEGAALPETWRGYSQHNDDCRPMDTRYVHGAVVLDRRDRAFRDYFRRPEYLEMINRKFGPEAVAHVGRMLEYKLPRKLLGGVAA